MVTVVWFHLQKNLNKYQFKDANDDKTLPVCWKGTKTYKSIQDVKNLFTPLVLSFTKSKNVQFQLSPEAYLIVSVSNISMLVSVFFFFAFKTKHNRDICNSVF